MKGGRRLMKGGGAMEGGGAKKSGPGMKDGHMGHAMSMGCGAVDGTAAKAFMKVNHQMHGGMAINFSCNHLVDFVRGMIPHHAGAIAMCDVLRDASAATQAASGDAYLLQLC